MDMVELSTDTLHYSSKQNKHLLYGIGYETFCATRFLKHIYGKNATEL